MRRGVTAAISGSCVTRAMVRPSWLSRRNKLRISFAGVRVEVAGRFVGENDFGIIDQRAGDGDALLLAAGKLHGPVLAAVFQFHQLERLHGALAALAARTAPL